MFRVGSNPTPGAYFPGSNPFRYSSHRLTSYPPYFSPSFKCALSSYTIRMLTLSYGYPVEEVAVLDYESLPLQLLKRLGAEVLQIPRPCFTPLNVWGCIKSM